MCSGTLKLRDCLKLELMIVKIQVDATLPKIVFKGVLLFEENKCSNINQ